MKVFLAGVEEADWLHPIQVADHPYGLFSYYYWKQKKRDSQVIHRNMVNRAGMEMICDSGLFTLMFGAGKGGNYDMPFMKDYTKQYIKAAKDFGMKKVTIVESDVHKLLGMKAVFELRKHFHDSGLNCLYVWHREEGIDGLIKMSEKYDYIALSIPELRILFKGKKTRYQQATHQLLTQIKNHCGEKMPKIHLLGNTVQETMETTLAYSCDSTSWKAGCRFGTVIDFRDGKLGVIRRRSDRFLLWEKEVYPKYSDKVKKMNAQYAHNPILLSNHISNLYSAMTMARYQAYLDRQYPWTGIRGTK